MSLGANQKLSNIRRSIQRYFVETIETPDNGISFYFDNNAFDVPTTVAKWVVLNSIRDDISDYSGFEFDCFMCAKNDDYGRKCLALRDIIYDAITDFDNDQCGLKRITLYDIDDDAGTWTDSGNKIVFNNLMPGVGPLNGPTIGLKYYKAEITANIITG